MRRTYQEYDEEKVEERSKEFLKKVMGEEKFNRLQKDGKIEIEYGEDKNKTIYELYSNGRVINKTKNQSYCIVADRSDYPTDDMVAIKYAWLVHGNEIAEKVANKSPLGHVGMGGTSVGYGDFVRDMEQRGWIRQQHTDGTPSYGDYVDYLLGQGWHRELLTIDQNNTNIATTNNVQKETTGKVIDIRCPVGNKISIMGTRQVPHGADANVAYSLGLCVADESGEEILDDTKIRITKEKPSNDIIQLARIFYADIKMRENADHKYRFKHGIELNGEEHLEIYTINSQSNICAENVKFGIEVDMWARDS